MHKKTLDQEELQSISKITNPTKNTELIHYTTVIWGEINVLLDKVRFHSLMILLDSGTLSSIVLGKHTKKFQKKRTKMICCSTHEVTLTLIAQVKYKLY